MIPEGKVRRSGAPPKELKGNSLNLGFFKVDIIQHLILKIGR